MYTEWDNSLVLCHQIICNNIKLLHLSASLCLHKQQFMENCAPHRRLQNHIYSFQTTLCYSTHTFLFSPIPAILHNNLITSLLTFHQPNPDQSLSQSHMPLTTWLISVFLTINLVTIYHTFSVSLGLKLTTATNPSNHRHLVPTRTAFHQFQTTSRFSQAHRFCLVLFTVPCGRQCWYL